MFGQSVCTKGVFALSVCAWEFESKRPWVPATMGKDVRQLVTAERHLPLKCTNFGIFINKVYEF